VNMKASKAVAGGIGGALATIANWIVTLIPGWSMVPDDVRGAINLLIGTAIVSALVYVAPPNSMNGGSPNAEP
jgi:hypothetical protein